MKGELYLETNKYQSNSHKSKEAAKQEKENVTEMKKLQPVVNSKVTVKKKGATKKFTDIFVAADLKSVGEFLFTDFIVPTAQKLFVDLVSSGASVLMYGERGASTRRSNADRYAYGSTRHTDYNRMSERRGLGYGAPAKPVYSYDDIYFETRGEAEVVKDRLLDAIYEYGMVSVGDLYDLVEITGNYTDYKYGWTDLRTATVERSRDGFYIRLPRAIALK
jgi:hypothetical protein